MVVGAKKIKNKRVQSRKPKLAGALNLQRKVLYKLLEVVAGVQICLKMVVPNHQLTKVTKSLMDGVVQIGHLQTETPIIRQEANLKTDLEEEEAAAVDSVVVTEAAEEISEVVGATSEEDVVVVIFLIEDGESAVDSEEEVNEALVKVGAAEEEEATVVAISRIEGIGQGVEIEVKIRNRLIPMQTGHQTLREKVPVVEDGALQPKMSNQMTCGMEQLLNKTPLKP